MLALSESNSVVSISSRARPRVQGSTFATIQRTLHQEPSLVRIASHPQALLGNSLTSGKRLHRADHSNQQYSILAISNASGAVVERVAYQAYGQPTFTNAAGTNLSSSAKATRYSYTGREWDPSVELHHFRARWASNANGRFLGRDPIRMEAGNLSRLPFGILPVRLQTHVLGFTIGHSRYEYCVSNPNNYLDSSGRFEESSNSPNFKQATKEYHEMDEFSGSGKKRTRRNCYYPENLASYGKWCRNECRSGRQAKDPEKGGCTLVGQGPFGFTPACHAHDLCWTTCGADQSACDRQFFLDMTRLCMNRYDPDSFWQNRCLDAAANYYFVVSNMDLYFEKTQDNFCEWNACGKWQLAPENQQPRGAPVPGSAVPTNPARS